MKHNLRLVILDYPKLLLQNETAKKIFSDVICTKQINFERTSNAYVSLGSLDMVSTHVLVYDQTDMFAPRQIGGARICYQNRTDLHQLKLPIQDYIGYTPPDLQGKFEKFKQSTTNLVDINAWYVDPDYTFSQTGLKLSELIFFGFLQFIVRKGFDRWVGTTNERYKASRWAMPTGHTEDGMIFKHPKVDDPHKLLLFESLNYDWLAQCSEVYQHLVETRVEVVPSAIAQEKLMTVAEFDEVVNAKRQSTNLKVAA